MNEWMNSKKEKEAINITRKKKEKRINRAIKKEKRKKEND